MKTLLQSSALALALALGAPLTGLAATPPAAPAASQAQNAPAWLGVSIRPVPPALAAQFPKGVPGDQGLLVVQVAADSPAAQAGIQPYDILLAYGDQKLYSPDQLVRLVRDDGPGKQVRLRLIRKGQTQDVEVTLASRPPQIRAAQPQRPALRHLQPRPPMHHAMPGPGGQFSQHWERFQAFSLERTGEDKYKATIDYQLPDGTKKHLEFQGSREEIRHQVMGTQDLPDAERRQILNALEGRGVQIPFDDLFHPFDWGHWGWPQGFENWPGVDF